ncbi:MAG: Holliday junction resolvase RuvX [Acidimicrobiales bacterium]
MRAVGVDLGQRRIGIAVSDSAGITAVPHATLPRSGGGPDADHRALAAVVGELAAECVVVGLPLSLDGSRGSAARIVEAEAAALGAVLPVPVELVDERFTTVTANRSLAGGGVRGRARRHKVDEVAATVLLQTWLDGQRRAAAHGVQATQAGVPDEPRSEST